MDPMDYTCKSCGRRPAKILVAGCGNSRLTCATRHEKKLGRTGKSWGLWMDIPMFDGGFPLLIVWAGSRMTPGNPTRFLIRIVSVVYLYGCFLKWWVFPPFHTPKWWFFVGRPMVVGETHHFRKPPNSHTLLIEVILLMDKILHRQGW